jgi:DNA-binding transcriptional ArsR family regulator
MPSAVAVAGDLTVATSRLFRVLGDPTRLAIVELLAERPRTVSELVEATGSPQSRVSSHLACLRWCRIVEDERHGRHVTYRLRDDRILDLVRTGRDLAAEHCDHLATCRRIGPDWV